MAVTLGVVLQERCASGHIVQDSQLPALPPTVFVVGARFNFLVYGIDSALDTGLHGRQLLGSKLAVSVFKWDRCFLCGGDIEELVTVIGYTGEMIEAVDIALPAMRGARPAAGQSDLPGIARRVDAREEPGSELVMGAILAQDGKGAGARRDGKPQVHVGRLECERHLTLVPQRTVARPTLGIHGHNAGAPIGMQRRVVDALEIYGDLAGALFGLQADDVEAAESR